MMHASPLKLPSSDSDHLILSFGVALSLHIGLLLILPRLYTAPDLPPLRIEAQFAQMQPEQPPAETPQAPEPEPPKPVEQTPVEKPREITKQVLTAKEEAPPTPHEVAVPETPALPEPVQEAAPPEPVKAMSEPVNTAAQSSNINTTQANAEPEEANPTEAWENYGQLLQNMVAKNKIYPQIAIRRNLEGTAMVSARFTRGRLVALVLLDPTSGHKVLDEAAMEMLKKAVNALPVKGELAKKSFTVIVPVDFKLDS